MNEYVDGEPTRYLILMNMLEYLTYNEPTVEWKEKYIEYVEEVSGSFMDPLCVVPANQEKSFRKLVEEISLLATRLYVDIHYNYTYDAKVFQIFGNHIMKLLKITMDDNNLVESMGSMSM